MKIKALIAASACVALLAGCTNNPYTGEREAGKAGVYGGGGAAAGALIGAATSSKKDRGKGALIGAVVVAPQVPVTATTLTARSSVCVRS